ncbi:hypothetical protein N9A73_02070, partial [Akkermansiaceae bacterium]|nr:hypothetical protein [Akkermansiaceae bacterium]
DGRAHDLLDQVRHPFFDKNEMNIAGAKELAGKFRSGDYAKEFEDLTDKEINEKTFEALVAFLREPMFRPFNSRIDEYWAGDKEALSLSEKRGLDVFQTSGGCSTCHLTGVASWPKPLLTDLFHFQAPLGLLGKSTRDLELSQERLGNLGNSKCHRFGMSL